MTGQLRVLTTLLVYSFILNFFGSTPVLDTETIFHDKISLNNLPKNVKIVSQLHTFNAYIYPNWCNICKITKQNPN